VHKAIVASMVVVCLLGTAGAGFAQQVTAGLKGGLTAASLPGIADAFDVAVDQQLEIGATAGIFVTARLSDLVAFQPEVLYAMRGATITALAVGEEGTVTFDTRYLELPLLLKVGRASRRLYFLVGPAMAFRLAAESREVFDGVTGTTDVSDQTTRVDVGLAIGGGAAFGRFSVEGRWTEGLRNIERTDQFDTSVRNRAFALLAGVRF
jgi:Outer membrane protein beta-barrel domain